MIDSRQKKILMLAVRAGEILMKNGAEVYRVEDTMSRICKACDIEHVEVFATPTGIFISLDKGGDDDDTQTYVKNIKSRSTNLHRISAVDSFSRQFTTSDMTIEEGMEILDNIDGDTYYPLVVKVFGAAMIASFFAVFFGGNAVDFGVAFIAGIVSYLLSVILDKIGVASFIQGFCCCAISAIIALIASVTISGASYSYIIIGTLMIYVPGVAITNAVRDFISGEMLAGTARMMEAALIAVSLAAGAGLVLKLWELTGGVII